ncbi:pantoate--beta-alanine ligase [Cellulomonas cellasea]|uniref:Pantothenate synthetase n=1 Tax=Cellulomonas cellasea TaxID=43670 RepID=A0A4Y3KY32_9CELL|nr:pantoate--beta-alanine ligase [Cellulomonas cellasea]GEA88115.1 pantothenate synthetase [Cellulomonas cellasea]
MTAHEHRSGPALVRTRAELAAALAAQDAGGGGAGTDAADLPARAVVMTMGALHAGHLELVRAARAAARHVVVTIFVNPLQFGAGEDLDRYPRDLDGDLALLAGDGLLGPGDVVFAPTPDVVYPGGDPMVRVAAGRIGEVLEGRSRPGHLDGVLTVVLKLLHLTRPSVALFGEKDAQQLSAVRRMVHDLDVPVEVRGVPTVRDVDGLALSSRNAYLSPGERTQALSLSRGLVEARDLAEAGKDPGDVVHAVQAALAQAGVVDVDYVALVDAAGFEDVRPGFAGTAVLAVAARVGSTRLIDNVRLTLGDPEGAGPDRPEGTR